MATTRLIPHHISSGRTIAESMRDRFDYGKDPVKTLNGSLIRAYECDPMTADAEFLLTKAMYKTITGRAQDRGADVLCYQIRQSFPPGELSPQEALDIGYELAMRWTKGRHAFFVVSHADRPHPHVHIYYNSTALDCTQKFRDFFRSGRALRQLSDRVCLEHELSIIQNPKLHSEGKFRHYGEWLGADRKPSQKEQLRALMDAALEARPANLAAFLALLEEYGVQVLHGRGGAISFQLADFQRPTRWRGSTLGDGYGPEEVRAILEGRAPARPTGGAGPRRKINLVIDIQQRMAQGKGAGYEHWAKLYNLKQMAAALQFLQENGLTDYDLLSEKTEAAVDRAHTLAGELRAVEEELSQTSALMGAVVDYARTRPVFDGYKAARYSRNYLTEHEEELAAYRAARSTMNEILDGAKLPKMEKLKQERRELAERKKSLTAQYRAVQKSMRELVAVKGNIDHLLHITNGRGDKEQAR